MRNKPQYYFILCVSCCASSASVSADTVRLATASGVGTIEITGEIVEYTGREITIRRATGGERAHPAERVIEIDTNWPAGYAEGRAALAAHDYRLAIQQLTAATRGDGRPWVRRLLMIDLMHAYAAAGDWATAGDLFVSIAASDRATRAIESAPLAWFAARGAPPAKVKAWLADVRSPAAQLLGASHALSSSLRSEGVARLRELKTSADPRIAFLAEAQSWRAQIATASPEDVARWESLVHQAPETLRAGAWFVLGEVLAQQNEHDRAALAYLRAPILSPDSRQLAARALLEASRAMLAAGDKDSADKIARDLASDYADTPPAKQAPGVLQSAGGGGH